MDSFHLAHELLETRGQVDVKGAPETFYLVVDDESAR